MRRSELDAAIDASIALARRRQFELPGFAHWSRQDWLDRTPDLGETLARGLGWDVTDFGRGDFARYGLSLCTIRNGSIAERDAGAGQTYAEKFMRVEVGQETPFHLHERKVEDIINRGGGDLIMELYPSSGRALGEGTVTTLVDGVVTIVDAGRQLRVRPGESVQVPTGVFHRFWAVDEPVLAMEVSGVNDDAADNLFLDEGARYAAIDEDAPARYLLVSEYDSVLGR
ncbi:MAG: hypothetical protein JWQ12_928 [Glaciihabitans sp.]|nr:hypothetical protein [Glaciihabitans sp.]